MTIEEIRQQLETFKLIHTRNSITPESLGTLLENIVESVSTELTTTVENITTQGETTVEQVQQQLQSTIESVTEQISSAVTSFEEQMQEHRTSVNDELVITRNNVQTLVRNVQQQMEEIQSQVAMTMLEVTVATSKTEFTNKSEWAKVWNAMQNSIQLPFCIAVVFASGSKNFYYPTCVKTNYISLNAKAGSCELHVNEDGTFSITGTNLW